MLFFIIIFFFKYTTCLFKNKLLKICSQKKKKINIKYIYIYIYTFNNFKNLWVRKTIRKKILNKRQYFIIICNI